MVDGSTMPLHRSWTRLGAMWREGRTFPGLAIAAIVAFATVIGRRPDAFFAPQFSWEDGPNWYGEARNLGWRGLGRVYNGYLCVPQRLVGLISQLVPMRAAPFLFAVCASIVQTAPALYLLSRRATAFHPSVKFRALLAFAWLFVPASNDTNANVAHMQWPLTMLAILIVAANVPVTWRQCTFDVLAITAAGLASPIGLMLVPIVALRFVFERNRRILLWLLVAGATAATQAYALLKWPDARAHPRLGASFVGGARILFNRVVLSSMFGTRGAAMVAANWTSSATKLVALAAFGAWAAFALRSVARPYLWVMLACGALSFASIVRPGIAGGDATWFDLLTDPGAGDRYFFLTVFAILGLALAAARVPSVVGRLSIAVAVAAALIGIPVDAVESPHRGERWARSVSKFEAAPVGARVSMQAYPLIEVVLTKRRDDPQVPLRCTDGPPAPAKVVHADGPSVVGDLIDARRTGGIVELKAIGVRDTICDITISTGPDSIVPPQGIVLAWTNQDLQPFSGDHRRSAAVVNRSTLVFSVLDEPSRLRLELPVGSMVRLGTIVLRSRVHS